MKVVIQCAASKNAMAGYWRNTSDDAVLFVAHPRPGLPEFKGIYAIPDGRSDASGTWRDQLIKYNSHPGENPYNLFPAYRLYQNDTYQALVNKFGIEQVFILSAGWGLIRADFLTPQYDITFSASAEAYKRRKKNEYYNDLCMLPETAHDPIVFLGGKDYLPLFCRLAKAYKGPKRIFYNSDTSPQAQGFQMIRYQTNTRTNWHYECAKALISGSVRIAD